VATAKTAVSVPLQLGSPLARFAEMKPLLTASTQTMDTMHAVNNLLRFYFTLGILAATIISTHFFLLWRILRTLERIANKK
jgi:hypothetical protein